MRTGFIGVGKLGLDCATEMYNAGHAVQGYDTREISAPFPMVPFETVAQNELIFIAVPTPHDPQYGGETPSSDLAPRDFDYTIVEDILRRLNAICTKDQLIVLISTVLPGTIRSRFASLITNYQFAYNPYLIAMGSIASDMVNPEMVIIGTEDGATVASLEKFYSTMMRNNPRYVIGTWEEAECIKIFYNTFISTKITLVNMIQDVAEKIGNIDCDIVATALAQSSQRITGPAFMKPGMGDAGACHPRDNIALSWLAQEYDLRYDVFATIMEAREQQARHIASRLFDLHLSTGLPVYIHGKSYKPGVEYTNGSYSLLIESYLRIDVTYIDPLTEPSVPASVKGIVLMAHHAPTTYSHSYAIGANTQAFYTAIEPGSIVVDPWRYLSEEDVPGCRLIRYGNTRRTS